jgi:hypothetical protein
MYPGEFWKLFRPNSNVPTVKTMRVASALTFFGIAAGVGFANYHDEVGDLIRQTVQEKIEAPLLAPLTSAGSTEVHAVSETHISEQRPTLIPAADAEYQPLDYLGPGVVVAVELVGAGLLLRSIKKRRLQSMVEMNRSAAERVVYVPPHRDDYEMSADDQVLFDEIRSRYGSSN